VHIFYCAGGKFREVAGVFLAHRTLVLVAPDARSERPTLARVSRAHRTLAPDADRTLFARPTVLDVRGCF